jgi:mRNA interferase MazF
MTVERGDVVLVRFPFSDGSGMKIRPALVVQCDRNNRRLENTIVVMISRTTQRATTEATQLLIDLSTQEGRDSGLLHDSAVKCENLFTVQQSLILRRIGKLEPTVMRKVDGSIKASLGLA